jgi:hypothetical protein
MDVVFSVQARLFAVFRDTDGSLRWSDFDGKKVNAAFPSDDGMRCILLLERDSTTKPRFENLFCVDRDGARLWTATLPDTRDRFVVARMEADGLHATSLSGYSVTFDPSDGRAVQYKFVK